jgi:hypothetical protein
MLALPPSAQAFVSGGGCTVVISLLSSLQVGFPPFFFQLNSRVNAWSSHPAALLQPASLLLCSSSQPAGAPPTLCLQTKNL